MTTHIFEHASELPAPAHEVYAWHTRPGAFERLQPPWEKVTLVESGGRFEERRVVLEVSFGPLPTRWVAQHRDVVPGQGFVDEQVSGPFASWVHTHRFEPLGPDHCRMVDRIAYQLPLGAAGDLTHPLVERRLQRTFRWRHDTLRGDLAQLRRAGLRPLTIAVTGASGLIGTNLSAFLRAGGHTVVPMVRRQASPGEISWDPEHGTIDSERLIGVDAVVHLAGENIAERWTEERKRNLLESRRRGTALLAETMARLGSGPRTLVAASAVGIYGNRGDEALTDAQAMSPGENAGRGFLAELARVWEESTAAAREADIRVANARLGVVLTPAGGALAKMLPPFQLGIAGPLGDGRQWMSWISIDDAIGAIYHALSAESIQGPFNAVAPAPVRNAEFTRLLGAVLHRPALIPVPAAGLRLLFGAMADEVLLSSARVLPRVLEQTGYEFRHADLEGALHHVLGR